MRRVILGSLFLGLGGCVHTNAAVLNPTASYARTCADAVIVYLTPDRVKSQYVEVALLNSTGNAHSTSEAGMIHSQRQKAAEVGANAIILGGIDEPSAGAKVAGAFLGTPVSRKGKALAIWVSADSAKTRATCDSIARHG
jgi:hypothetical protein